MLSHWTVVLSGTAALGLAGCAAPPRATDLPPAAGWGDSKATAIEVCRPAGQRAYLAQLVCPDGSRPSYRRSGNVGPRMDPPASMTEAQNAAVLAAMLAFRAPAPGERDHHIVDAYELSCGAVRRTLYLDMYHCDRSPPEQAPAGYTLRP
jgi:hypothetical protein